MKTYKVYLKHIIIEIDYLINESRNLSFEEFERNETLKRAFVRSIEIIGEAIKNIPYQIRDKYPNVEWKKIAGTRDKLIHHYFGIDYETIWDIIKNKISNLNLNINKILEGEIDNDLIR